MEYRDINDPKWKAVRFATFKRDGFQCQKCLAKGVPMQCHHIIPFAQASHLQFKMNNLITLCVSCHTVVTGRESQYEEEFKKCIILKSANKQYGLNKINRSKVKYKRRNPNMRW